MKKIISALFLTVSLLFSTFPVSAHNIMSYFKTVHIVEHDKKITPEEMFLLVKESAKKQVENSEQLKVIPQNNGSISTSKISGASILDYLRSR